MHVSANARLSPSAPSSFHQQRYNADKQADFDLDTQDYLNPLPSQIQNSKDIVRAKLADQSATDYLSIQHDIVGQSVTNLTSYFFDQIKARGWKGVTAAECLGDTDKENWYRSLSSSTPSSTAAPGPSTTARPSTTTTTVGAQPTTSIRPTTTKPGPPGPTQVPPPPPPQPQCIKKNGNWCGTIDAFQDYNGCKKSADDCRDEQRKCLRANVWGFSECVGWSGVCAKLSMYCLSCKYGVGGCSDKGFKA